MMDVYLIAGQSNALGISPVSGMSEQYSFSSLLYQASNVSVPSPTSSLVAWFLR